MNPHENIMNALGVLARQDLVSAMVLEACLEFTTIELHNATADAYFMERFGERLHKIVSDIKNHM